MPQPHLEKRYPQLHQLMRSASALHLDLDHTIISDGVSLDKEFADGVVISGGSFDVAQLPTHEQENLELLALLALSGLPISIITAREASFYPLATYFQQLLHTSATQYTFIDGHRHYSDGRLKTIERTKPVVFTCSTSNGALSSDVFDTEYFYRQELPMAFWQGMADLDVQALLRASTSRRRFELTSRVTPQLGHLATSTKPAESLVELWQQIGDFALLSPQRTRVNLRLEVDLILADRELHQAWLQKTGVDIQAQSDVRLAFELLSQNWGIHFTGSNSSPTIDIMDATVNKAASMQIVRDYIQTTYDRYGASQTLGHDLTIGDTPEGNDGPMLRRPGGVSVTAPIQVIDGWPVFFDQGTSTTERTLVFLQWLLATRS